MLKGVKNTLPGYAGGDKPNPTYEEVCNYNTGHAEVLMIEYDEEIITLKILLEVFFEMHDPTSLNKQGADTGTQYRSAIFYYDEIQKSEIEKFILEKQKLFDKKIVTEVKKLNEFYPAEEYHKNYYIKNKEQPYCSYVISPKVEKIKKEFKKLTKWYYTTFEVQYGQRFAFRGILDKHSGHVLVVTGDGGLFLLDLSAIFVAGFTKNKNITNAIVVKLITALTKVPIKNVLLFIV